MSTVARRIAASPKRTATEVWEIILGLLCEKSSSAQNELSAVMGVAASIISEEIPSHSPLIVKGSGPRVRIYCQYGEDALSNENCNETPLAQKPLTGKWKLYLPCNKEDLEWVSKALIVLSSSIVAYDKATEPAIEEETSKQTSLTLNKENFLTKL